MVGEIPYMIVWGFFSAMGWMGANWAMDKAFPDKQKDKPAIEKQVEDKDGRDIELPKQKNKEERK